MQYYTGKVRNYATGCYNKQLLEAVAAQDKDKVLNALEQGADVNYQKPHPPELASLKSILFWSNEQRLKAAEIAREELGTALHHCAANGNEQIAHILLEHGAKTTLKNFKKEIPLYIAGKNYKLEMVKLFLEKTPDCLDKTLQCMWINKLLVTLFCNPQLREVKNKIFTIITEYLKQKRISILQNVLVGKQINSNYFTNLPNDIRNIIIAHAVEKKLEKELLLSVKYSTIQEAQTALKAGANVNMKIKNTDSDNSTEQLKSNTFFNLTLFHLAVAKKNIPMAKLLLEYCITISAQDLIRDFKDTVNINAFTDLIKEYETQKAQPTITIEEIQD